jgi:hypothetical protein
VQIPPAKGGKKTNKTSTGIDGFMVHSRAKPASATEE